MHAYVIQWYFFPFLYHISYRNNFFPLIVFISAHISSVVFHVSTYSFIPFFLLYFLIYLYRSTYQKTLSQKSTLFWNVTQHRFIFSYRRFGWKYRFHLQGSSTLQRPKHTFFIPMFSSVFIYLPQTIYALFCRAYAVLFQFEECVVFTILFVFYQYSCSWCQWWTFSGSKHAIRTYIFRKFLQSCCSMPIFSPGNRTQQLPLSLLQVSRNH